MKTPNTQMSQKYLLVLRAFAPSQNLTLASYFLPATIRSFVPLYAKRIKPILSTAQMGKMIRYTRTLPVPPEKNHAAIKGITTPKILDGHGPKKLSTDAMIDRSCETLVMVFFSPFSPCETNSYTNPAASLSSHATSTPSVSVTCDASAIPITGIAGITKESTSVLTHVCGIKGMAVRRRAEITVGMTSRRRNFPFSDLLLSITMERMGRLIKASTVPSNPKIKRMPVETLKYETISGTDVAMPAQVVKIPCKEFPMCPTTRLLISLYETS